MFKQWFNKFRPVFARAILFVLAASFANEAQAVSCRELLASPALGAELLEKFSFEEHSPTHLKKLSSSVYRLSLGEEDYVIRFNSFNDDLKREQFAVKFVNQLPGLHTPQVRLLSIKETKLFLEALWKTDTEAYFEIAAGLTHRRENIQDKKLQMSVASYYEATLGKDVLSQLRVTNQLREFLVRVSATEFSIKDSDRGYYLRALENFWNAVDYVEKKSVVEDLKTLLPDTKNISNDDYLDYLLKNFKSLSGSRVQELTVLGLARIPARVRQQLADYWAAYTLLGIPDFHYYNWLLFEDKVIAIDLAFNISKQPTELGIDLRLHQHPFGNYSLSENLKQYMFDEMSPELLTYLSQISRPSIIAMALEAGYPITASEADSIMSRLAALLAKTSGPR